MPNGGTARIVLCICLLLSAFPAEVAAPSPFAFQGNIGRRVLSNYLSRAITMSNMLEERNAFLEYAWQWVRSHDRFGFVEMPGLRDIQGVAENDADWYYANSPSSHPYGFDQEETIKEIRLNSPLSYDPAVGARSLLF